MAERSADVRAADASPLRSWINRHPIATFLVLVYATTTALVFVPRVLTEPGVLPGGATPHGVLENVLGSAVPAFIVTAVVSGRAGVRDLARRSLRWRVPLRWYLISLLAPPLILLIAITTLYGFAPLRALGRNWLQLFTAFLPALAVMILLNNVAEEIGWTGFVFARLQDRHGPLRAALLATVFFWLFHVPSFYVETRSWVTTALVFGHLPAAASGQPIDHWLALQRRRIQRVDRRIVPFHAQRHRELHRLGGRGRSATVRSVGDHGRHCREAVWVSSDHQRLTHMQAEPVEAPTEEELITSPCAWICPSSTGRWEARASTAGVGTSSSPTGQALEDDLLGRRQVNPSTTLATENY
ncbi:MAG TPA: type II CAAX endopeptidase family protein [Propionibacteriaceae bacterium]|nr:type II CAAX endopeptidase family protein [Propionibacteriaceae bacterium]